MMMKRGLVWDGDVARVVDDLEVRPPGHGEVMVRVQASGICQSDLHVIDRRQQADIPVVLGHEAAGVVEQVGLDDSVD